MSNGACNILLRTQWTRATAFGGYTCLLVTPNDLNKYNYYINQVSEEELEAEAAQGARTISVALVGRPNVGKSSMFNRLYGAPRAIVSEMSGTTRDTLDAEVEKDGRVYR